eukprot:s2638_g4.t1
MDEDVLDDDLRSRGSGYTATSPCEAAPLEVEETEGNQDSSHVQSSESEIPFRALDLLGGTVRFRRDIAPPRSPGSAELGSVPKSPELEFGTENPLETHDSELPFFPEASERLESVTDESVEIIEPDAGDSEPEVYVPDSDVVAPLQTWNEMDVQSTSALQHQLSRFLMPEDAKYMHAVKSIQDMSYFEGKAQQLDLACGQWLRILSVCWSASGVGPQLASALQKDSNGVEACVILKACFGVKSPSTLLKRASAFKKYFTWFEKSKVCQELNHFPLPLEEPVIWEYFPHLKQQRENDARGYTVPSSFLEAVRFAKFTLDLSGTEAILGSRRARWSDMRYVDHAEVTPGDSVTFYTTEHKTASVGLRREQYMPIVVPWHGICADDWLAEWLRIYEQVGLDVTKRPMGPLLPAPRIDGTFCARPLSTAEAACWLRALLQGTSNSDSFRSHSLKASLLLWCARAGLDKESRAVLGHHCSALNGSEVVYSRHLQTRALRKLGHILRRVRAGLNIEDDIMKEYGIINTPLPFTPVAAAKTPVPPHVESAPALEGPAAVVEEKQAVDAAIEAAANLEDLQSVKEEELNAQAVEAAASELTLYPVEIVSAGVVEIESSSGSDSESSTSDSDSSSGETVAQAQGPHMVEDVPEGVDYYKHAKSGLVHSCKTGQETTSCKIQIGVNFKKLGRKLYVVHPKCIRCFPKNHNRIRSCEQMSASFDAFLKRSRASDSKESK